MKDMLKAESRLNDLAVFAQQWVRCVERIMPLASLPAALKQSLPLKTNQEPRQIPAVQLVAS